jgi:hypothetical protein
MRYLLFALVALGLAAAPAAAQNRVPLDARVHNFQLPRQQLPACGVDAILLHVAKETGVAIGMERTSECDGHIATAFPHAYKPLNLANAEVLDGVTVKEVLGRVAALAPDYDWAIMEGVAVFRPSSAWRDSNDALAARVPAMRFFEVPVYRILGTILQLPGDRGPKKIMSIDFPGGTVLEALNALARSQPVMWHATSNGERLFVSVMSVPDGSGFSAAATIPTLFNRRIPSSY